MSKKRASGRSLDEWMDLVTECRQSGLTDAAFSNDYYGLIFRATQSVELFCTYFQTSNNNIFLRYFHFNPICHLKKIGGIPRLLVVTNLIFPSIFLFYSLYYIFLFPFNLCHSFNIVFPIISPNIQPIPL